MMPFAYLNSKLGAAPVKSEQNMKSLSRPSKALRPFILVSLSATLLSLAAALYGTWRHGAALGFSGFWPPLPNFDFYVYLPRFAFRHTSTFFTFPGFPWYYPASSIFLYAPFYYLASALRRPTASNVAFVITVLLVSGWLLFLLRKRLVQHGLTLAQANIFCSVLVAVSWPLYLVCQRGNIEGFIWAITCVAVWSFRSRRFLPAAILLGVAASFKIYPGLFFALFLVEPKERRWIALGLLVALLTTLAGLWFLDHNVVESWHYVSSAVKSWTEYFSGSYPNHPYDHSIFAQVHLLAGPVGFNQHRFLHAYYVLAAIFATGIALRVKSLPFANQVLFLSCAAITLPPVSFDYTLCLMYLPLSVLSLSAVQAEQKEVRILALRWALGLLGLVIAPSLFVLRSGQRWPPSTVKCLSLLGLIAISALKPLSLNTGGSSFETVPSEGTVSTDRSPRLHAMP